VFTQSHRVATGGFVLGVAMADFNRDGFADVVASNQDQSTVSVLVSLGNGTFAAKQDFSTGLQPSAVAAGDWNNDGSPDIAAPYRNLSNTASTSILLQVPQAADTIPPSAPSGLRASNITQTTVDLAWDPASDNVGVAGYQLYELVRRQWVLQVNGITGLSITVTGLKARSNHQYAVAAYDAAGNVSALSATLTVRTLR
ncbi:MAG: FG-GAP-like repeat-containing protein, partial [Chthoniobacterales bacterium]